MRQSSAQAANEICPSSPMNWAVSYLNLLSQVSNSYEWPARPGWCTRHVSTSRFLVSSGASVHLVGVSEGHVYLRLLMPLLIPWPPSQLKHSRGTSSLLLRGLQDCREPQ